jgi:hypothetical protein
MSRLQNEFESLGRAFAERAQSPAALEECPKAELLFDAASGSLERDRRLAIIEHVARCAECAMAMRLAMELGARPGSDSLPEAAITSRHSRWLPRVALAASVIAAVGLTLLFLPRHDLDPQYRQPMDPSAVTSLVGSHLARERLLLRWSAGPPGSTYTLSVSSNELVALFSKRDVATTEYLVPADALAQVSPGEQIFWQVETRLPDGRRVSSDTFVVTLD